LPILCGKSTLREDERKVKIHWQRGAPRKAPTGQLDEIPWSLGVRSRKSEEGRSSKK
jgi:hypothetical protein